MFSYICLYFINKATNDNEKNVTKNYMWTFFFPKWLILSYVLVYFLQCYIFRQKGSQDKARDKTNIEILTKNTERPWN